MLEKYKKYDTKFTSSSELHPNSSYRMMFDLIEENKLVLDVGCSTGYLGKLLIKEKNCTVVGIDINPDVQKSLSNYYENFFVADLDTVSLTDLISDQKFDVIVFGDVLEHLKDPWRVLKESHDIIKPEGYVVASVPNIAHGAVILALLEGKFEYSKYGILDNTHLRFFTRESVLKLFKDCGFFPEIVNCTEINFLSNSELIPRIDASKFSVEVLEVIHNCPDINVLQFIIKAYPNLFAQLHATQQELVQTQSQLHAIQQELVQVKKSKFWKMRNLWLKIKRKLGMFRGISSQP